MAIDIQSLIGGSIADGVGKIISLFKVDPTVALQKQTELQEIQLKMQSDAAAAYAAQLQAQANIDQTEAASTDKYTSRARPTILWVCGCAFASNYVVAPFATWIAALSGHPIQYPVLDLSTMQPVMLGMLGLAGYHAYEKVKGA
jgi:hypothetical protein